MTMLSTNENNNNNNNNTNDNDTHPIPTPRKIVTYPVGSDPNCGSLYIFGGEKKNSNDNSSSSSSFVLEHLILLSAGYPDDQSIFLPLAYRLSIECPNALVGVTCMPGFDHHYHRKDRSYNKNSKPYGYTISEMTQGIREAFKVLIAEADAAVTAASNNGGDGATTTTTETTTKKPQLVGIFHDWAVVPGCMFTNQIQKEQEEEEKEKAEQNNNNNNDNNIDSIPNLPLLCPDKLILLDVAGGPHPETDMDDLLLSPEEQRIMKTIPADSLYQTIVTVTYRIILAVAFLIRRYISTTLAGMIAIYTFSFLNFLHLSPTYSIDQEIMDAAITKKLKLQQQEQNGEGEGEESKSLLYDQYSYMTYPYYQLFYTIITKYGGRTANFYQDISLPKNLDKTPTLVMYGTEKRFKYHLKSGEQLLLFLQQKQQQKQQQQQQKQHDSDGDTSRHCDRRCFKSKIIPVDNAGHWLYIQQPEICFQHVKQFILDE